MNNRLLFTLAALPLAAQGTAGEKKEAAAPNGDPRPNILFFLVDDMGWQDTSVPFHDEHTPLNDRYHTPNMERLARMASASRRPTPAPSPRRLAAASSRA